MGKLSFISLATVVASFATLLSSSAFAIVQPDGDFVPDQCGIQTNHVTGITQTNITSVCFGAIKDKASQALPAVSFRLEDGTQEVMKIANIQNYFVAFMNGDSKLKYFIVDPNGETQTIVVIQEADGHVASVSGRINDVSVRAESFQDVVVIE